MRKKKKRIKMNSFVLKVRTGLVLNVVSFYLILSKEKSLKREIIHLVELLQQTDPI